MSSSKKPLAFALLLIGLVAWAVIARHLPGQVDLTEENIYSLSDASRTLVNRLEEPVQLDYYFSRSLDELPVSIKNYGTLVEDLLRQYERASGGKVRLRVIDPKPDTKEQETATRAGLESQNTPTGDVVFFGLVATSGDQSAAIPVFTDDRESFLEYDVSQLIHKVTVFEKPVIGVISALDLFGNPGAPQNPYMQQSAGSPPWVFIEQLQGSYDVREISGDALPDNLTALALIHPGPLSEKLKYAVDQFLLSGRPVFAAVDPSSLQQRMSPQFQQQMMSGAMQGASSDLSGLLEAWGVEYSAGSVVGDARLATPISAGSGGPVQYPYWLTIRDFPKDSPLTSQLEEVWVIEPGSIAVADDSGLTLQPLLQTSDESGQSPAQMLAFQAPAASARSFSPDHEQRTVAGLITGEFKTAFPDGPPKDEAAEGTGNEPENGASWEDEASDQWDPGSARASGKGVLLVVADSDFITDDLSVRRVNFLGMSGVTPLNDNQNFALNAFDSLVGDETLLSLRGKGEVRRPFTRIDAMEHAAQEAYQRELDGLQKQLSDVESKLRDLQQAQGGQQLVATPEVMETIEEYRTQEASLRSQLREIRKKLREDVDALGFKLAAINIFLLPALILVVGIFSFVVRSRTRRAR